MIGLDDINEDEYEDSFLEDHEEDPLVLTERELDSLLRHRPSLAEWDGMEEYGEETPYY